LFALACQLVLSFGHVHLRSFSGGSATWTAADGAAVPVSVPPLSPQKDPVGLADDFCAICANIALANIIIVPDSLVLLAPNPDTQELLWSLAANEAVSIDHVTFNARGPPHS
jgi:hypothetical protein